MDDITILRTWDEPTADMAVNLLRNEGITVIKIPDAVRGILAFTLDGLGEIEIRVPENDAERAKEILDVRFSESTNPPEE
jgi:hypothetical protein